MPLLNIPKIMKVIAKTPTPIRNTLIVAFSAFGLSKEWWCFFNLNNLSFLSISMS
jgi:hypothetical protein